ncbi:hypothetical protein F0Z19_4049 [Vibrio cyclitrophicus]|nr:hypothetical protein M565_ctg1P0981 [Vibrio cyclitrophicus FF75]KAA8597361.1 hypothetical protein F0Z19_4049 [Vibrio cyclitrophicus]
MMLQLIKDSTVNARCVPTWLRKKRATEFDFKLLIFCG